jgi:hypothetical protein
LEWTALERGWSPAWGVALATALTCDTKLRVCPADLHAAKLAGLTSDTTQYRTLPFMATLGKTRGAVAVDTITVGAMAGAAGGTRALAPPSRKLPLSAQWRHDENGGANACWWHGYWRWPEG